MATIKGIKQGTSIITASYGSLTSTVNLTVAQLNVSNATIGELSNQTYNGSAFKLKPTVTMTVGGVSTTLVENTDYTLSWNSNSDGTSCIKVGTITVTVTGIGNYKGTNATRTYQITSASFTVKESDQSYVYNGSAQGAAISVSDLKGGQTATIKYGTKSGIYDLTSAPQITNVKDSKTIYWQVTAPNHTTKTGDYKLTITKATPGVPVLTKGTGNYNGSTTYYAKAANASKCVTPSTLSQPAGTIYYGASKGSTSNSIPAGTAANLTSMGRKEVGTTTIYAFFRPTDTDNYNDSAQTASTTVVVSKGTLTVTATGYNAVYNATSHNAIASISAVNQDHTTVNPSYTYSIDGTNYSDTMPTVQNANGSGQTIYWRATLTGYNDVSGSVTAKVTKATPGAPVLTKGTGYYNGSTTYYATAKNNTKCVTPSSLAQPAGTIYYGTSAGSTSYSITAGSTAANLTSMGRKDVGTTTIYAFFRPTDTTNYNDSATTANTTVEVSKGTMTITATGYSGTYDAASHTAVTFTAKNQSNATITPTYTYATTEGGTYSSTVPTVQNYTAGTKIYWKATLSGYNDASGNVTATVAKATPGIPILTNGSGVYDGSTTYYATAKNNTKCVTPSSLAQPAGKIYYGASVGSQDYYITAGSTAANLASMGRSGVGTTTIYAYFVPTDTTNYNSSATTASATVKVSSGTLTVTAVPYNRPYDGGSHNAITSISAVNQKGNPVNPSYTYSTDDTNYSATMPKVQNANGSGTTIYWKATLSGYNTASGSVKAIVGKVTPRFELQGETKPYHDGSHNPQTAWIKAGASVAGTVHWGSSSSSMTSTTAISTPSDAAFNTNITSRSASTENVGTTTIYAYFTPNDITNYNIVAQDSPISAAAKLNASNDNDISVTTAGTLYYTGAAQTIARMSSNEGCAHFTLGYSITSGGTVTWGTQDATTITATNPGTYFIHYKVTPDTNHSKTIDDKQIDSTVTIGNGTLTIAITGYSGTYDATAHNIVASGSNNPSAKNQANVNVTGVTYTYSDSENGTYSSSLTRTNATGTASNESATATYWVKAEKSGYTTAKQSFTVYIARADNPLTVTSPTTTSSNRHRIYNTSGYNTVQISTNGAQGAVSYKSSSTSYATVSGSGLVTYVAAGTPNITVTAAGNDNYKSGTVTVYIQTIVDTVTTYGDVTGTIVISQPTNFPASGISLSTSNISTYFTHTTPCTQDITWASGRHTSGKISYAWSGSNVTIPSLGTTETSSTTSRAINFTVTATGEGSKTTSESITSGKQEANPVTSIVLKVGGSSVSKTINFGDSATTEVTATYKSGSTGVITPTSITSSNTDVATVS